MPREHTEVKERVDPDPLSPWWGEHRSRYHFATKWAHRAKVLDCGCGTGFGLEILEAADATLVVGVDNSWEAISRAHENSGKGIGLCQGSGTKLPFQDGSIDLVVSFETIEHLDDDIGFLSEIHRVLRPTGLLILSTPNALHTRPVDGQPRNPFHFREYEPDQLEALLIQIFSQVTLRGQVVSDAYPINPYWEHPENLPRDPRGRLAVLIWRVQNRLPPRLKEWLSRTLHNRSFYPGEYDFVFLKEGIRRAHVTVAICSK